MKKQIVFILFFYHIISFAQYGNLNKTELAKIKSHKTYFVLDDDAYHPYNRIIKEAVEKAWTFNSYDFIPFAKFVDTSKNSEDSFFLRVDKNAHWKTSASGPTTLTAYEINGLVLIKGGTQYLHYPGTSLVYVSLPNWSVYTLLEDVSNNYSYSYKLDLHLLTMQEYMKTVDSSDGDGKLKIREAKRLYSKNKDVLKKKTLLINFQDMTGGEGNEAEIAKIYTKAFKLGSFITIQEAIAKKDDNILILNCALTSGWYHYSVAEASTGKIVYSNWIKPSSKKIKNMFTDLAK